MSRPAVAAQGDRLLRTPETDGLQGAVIQVLAMLTILFAVSVAVIFVPLPRTVAPEGIVTVSPGPVRLTAQGLESFALMEAESQRLSGMYEQGLALLANVAEAQQATIAAQVALMTQQNERMMIDAEISGLEDTRAEIMAAWRAEDARLAAELAEVESQLALLDSPSVIEVAAPISGTVEFVQSRPGQSVADGSELMVIAPRPVMWSADLYLTARQSAALRGLSDLTVKLAAPDGREFRMDARMVSASTTPIPAGKVADAVKFTVSADTPVYRARLAFEPKSAESAESAGLYVGQPLRIVAFLKAQSIFHRLIAQASSG